jgi:hypothetical protein
MLSRPLCEFGRRTRPLSRALWKEGPLASGEPSAGTQYRAAGELPCDLVDRKTFGALSQIDGSLPGNLQQWHGKARSLRTRPSAAEIGQTINWASSKAVARLANNWSGRMTSNSISSPSSAISARG